MTKTAHGWRLFAGTVLVAMAAHWLHEAGHMLMAMAFGASGTMGTNTVSYATEMSQVAVLWTTAAGPAVNVIFAIIAVRMQWRWAPAVLMAAFMQRLLAAVVSIFAPPNDEARLSLELGLGKWSIFAFTVGITLVLLIIRWRKDKLGWAWTAISALAALVGITIMVALNGVLPKIHF